MIGTPLTRTKGRTFRAKTWLAAFRVLHSAPVCTIRALVLLNFVEEKCTVTGRLPSCRPSPVTPRPYTVFGLPEENPVFLSFSYRPSVRYHSSRLLFDKMSHYCLHPIVTKGTYSSCSMHFQHTAWKNNIPHKTDR